MIDGNAGSFRIRIGAVRVVVEASGLPMSELITDKYPLEEINEALKKNLAMTGLKIAVVNK